MGTNDKSSPSENQTARTFRGGQHLRRAFKIVLVTYTLVAVLLGFFQRKLLYHPLKAKDLPVAADRDLMLLFPESKDLRLTCNDGTEIGAWWLRQTKTQDETRRPLVLYFHGNAKNRASRGPWYQIFADINADVMAIDYHGYGDSDGKMSEGGMYQDCDAAWAYATEELNYAPSEIIIAGTSLGGAAAVYTAYKQADAKNQPAALVVTATFSSMVDVAGNLYPWLPVSAILVDRYPSDERIAKVKCPIVVIHGDQDQLVPAELGRALFDAAASESQSGQPKKWASLEGIGHDSLVRLAGKQLQQEFQTVVNNLQQQR